MDIPGAVYGKRLKIEKPDNCSHDLKIREYLDCLFGTVLKAATSCGSGVDTINIIPNVVAEILRFNNIEFLKITINYINGFDEPIWFDIDISNTTLKLFVNEQMYEDFCNRKNSIPVTFINHQPDIERFNPLSSEIDESIQQSLINCAIVCDHVATHIIDQIVNTPDGSEPLHGLTFGRDGYTLHSLLRVNKFDENIPIKSNPFPHLGSLYK